MMRYSAKLTLLIISFVSLCFQLTTSSTVDKPTMSCMTFHQNNENATVIFKVACPGCGSRNEAILPLELSVRVAEKACDSVGVSLNGDDLTHNWNGSFGHGAGLITPLSGDAPLAVSWQSVCTTPVDSTNEQAVQHIIAWIERVGETDVGYEVGFTASFSQAQKPEILRLYSSPLNTSAFGLDSGDWTSLESLQCMDDSFGTDDAMESSEENIEWRWDHLQHLKEKARQLDRQIKQEEHKIREILQQDCPNLLLNWKECRSFGCKVQVSFRKVPDIIRQIRYQFGPFPSSLPSAPCPRCTSPSQCAKDPDSRPTPSIGTTHISQGNLYGPIASTVPVGAISSGYSFQYNAKIIFAICAVIVLVGALFALGFKNCRSTTWCRRRQADRAARWEERSTRRAYRFAARQLRWKQWWEGSSHEPVSTSSLDHVPLAMQQSEQIQLSDTEADLPSEPDVMQAEIRDFRKAFEYVGGLVGSPGRDPEAAYPPRKSSDDEVNGLLGDRRSKSPSTIASSTAVLSTVLSTGTSSILSLDTPSSLTVDTLETTETTPPSYHE